MERDLLLSVALILTILGNAKPSVLHFSVIASSEGDFNSSGSVLAIDLALKAIREQSVLPEEYALDYSIQDSKCDQVGSLKAFFSEVFYSNVTKLGLIGSGCSVAMEPVGLINNYWNIPLISPEPFGVQSSDRRLFPNQFNLFPSEDNFVQAFLALISQFEWKRVLVITQDENVFISVSRLLGQGLLQTNVLWAENRLSTKSNLNIMQNLFGSQSDDFRIFFLNMNSIFARKILCEASKRGLTYPRYAWITDGDYIDGWWRGSVSGAIDSCSDESVTNLLDRALAVQLCPVAAPNSTTNVGMTPAQFFSEYNAAPSSYYHTYVSALAYDAVWTLALALNTSMHFINSGNDTGCERESGSLVAWENFTYSNSKMGCLLRKTLQGTKFNGISGPVQFKPDGTRIYNVVTILQYSKGSAGVSVMNIGYVVGGNFSFSSGHNTTMVYPIIVPPDGTAINVTNGFNVWLISVFYVWSSVGVLLSVAFGIFNFVFKERKVIKLTSPKLNYYLIAGALVTYLATYMRLYPDISEYYVTLRCSLLNWLNLIGYSLAVGTLLAKMFRVYYIFNYPSPKKTLSDVHLMLIVLGIVGTCLIILTIGDAVPSFRPAVLLRPDLESTSDTNEYGVKQNYYVWQCYTPSSPLSYVSIALVYTHVAIQQIAALILAIKIRKVKIKTLNDSKYVVALVYISSMTVAIMALMTFSLGAYLNLSNVVYNGGFLFASTMFLLLLFVPKMYWLYKDPDGENVFSKSYTANQELPNTKDISSEAKQPRQRNGNQETLRVNSGTDNTVNELNNCNGPNSNDQNVSISVTDR